MSEYKFPVETIDLPSEGKVYPASSPLATGKLDVKYMTAREEDILTSTNIRAAGSALEQVINNLIATPGVKMADLVPGDIEAIIVGCRILAYGKDYPVELGCTTCGQKFTTVVDVSKLKLKHITEPVKDGKFSTVLPTGVEVVVRVLTRAQLQKVQEEVEHTKKLENIERDITILHRHMLVSVDGDTSFGKLKTFSENMLARDSLALRKFVKKILPGVDYTITCTCTHCGANVEGGMPMGADFFWPEA